MPSKLRNMRYLNVCGALLLTLTLYSCGGGGGGSDDGGGGTTPPPANVAPTANAGSDQTIDENTEVTLSGSGTDSDGSIASYAWTQTTGTSVTLTNANSASVTFTAPDINADETLTFKLTVTDNDGASDTDSVNVAVNNVSDDYPTELINGVPIAGLSGSGFTELRFTFDVPEGATNIQVSLTGGTGDGDLFVKYGEQPTTSNYDCRSWNLDTNETCGTDELTQSGGIYHILVNTYDSVHTFEEAILTGSYTEPTSNQATTVNAGESKTVDEAVEVTLSGSIEDPDSIVTSYHWTQIEGDTVTIADPDSLSTSFNSGQVDSEQVLTFQLEVNTNDGNQFTDTISITVSNTDLPAAIGLASEKKVYSGAELTLDAYVVDELPEGLSYEWSLSDSAITYTTDSNNRITFTTPTVSEETDLNVTVDITDALGQSSQGNLVLSVIPVNGDIFDYELTMPATEITNIVLDSNTSEYLAYGANLSNGMPTKVYFGNQEGLIELSLNTDGTVSKVLLSDKLTEIHFTDYTTSTVTITVKHTDGSVITEAQEYAINSKEISYLKEIFTSASSEVTANKTSKLAKTSAYNVANSETGNDKYSTLKAISFSANWATCVISGALAVGTGGVATPIAALACTSAVASTAAMLSDNETVQIVSEYLDGVSCLTGGFMDCGPFVINVINNGVNDPSTRMVTIKSPDISQSYVLNTMIDFDVKKNGGLYGDISTVEWDFGDNQISDQFSPSHSYAEVGQYTASVSVSFTQGLGLVGFDTVELMITEEPPVVVVSPQISKVVVFECNDAAEIYFYNPQPRSGTFTSYRCTSGSIDSCSAFDTRTTYIPESSHILDLNMPLDRNVFYRVGICESGKGCSELSDYYLVYNATGCTFTPPETIEPPAVQLAGDPEFQLTWTHDQSDDGPDIDLWVRDPLGNLLSSSREGLGLGPTPEGGLIDIDDRGKFSNDINSDGGGPERAYWPQNQSPVGVYSYGIRYFDGNTPVNYTMKVYKNGQLYDKKTGVLTNEGNNIQLGTVNNED